MAIGLVLAHAPTATAALPPGKCTEKRYAAVAKAAAGKLRCHAKGAAKGTGVDPACLAARSERLHRAFARIHERCPEPERTTFSLLLDTATDEFAADLWLQIAGQVIGASIAFVVVVIGVIFFPGTTRFVKARSRFLERTRCVDDVACAESLLAQIDAFADDVRDVVDPTTTTTSTSSSTSTTSSSSTTTTIAAVDFAGSPLSGPAALAVQFTALSPGPLPPVVWDFGDGGSSTEPNPLHVYQVPGTYTVTLLPQGGQPIVKPGYVTVF
jgi:hypothetical protein